MKIATGKTKSVPAWKVRSAGADEACFFNVIPGARKGMKGPEATLNQLGKGGPL